MSSNSYVQEESKSKENNKEFSFRWEKQFSYLTIKTVETKLKISNDKLNVESKGKHLGIIKGKCMTKDIALNSIQGIEIKKLITYSDIAFAVVFALAGFFNPAYFLLSALFIWTGINTSIVIKSREGEEIKIPANSKKEAEEFVDYIKEKANIN